MSTNSAVIKGYKLDIPNKTLTLTAAFCKAMNDPQSKEFKLYRQFVSDIPGLLVRQKSHNTPVKYRNSNGTVTKRNQFKGITYEHMDFFLNMLPDNENSKQIKDNYHTLRENAKGVCNSPYAAVGKWFLAQFPKYKTNPLSYLKEAVNPIDISSFLEAKDTVIELPHEGNQEQEKTV